MLPKSSTFTVYNDPVEVAELIKVAENMGYKYTVKTENLAGTDKDLSVTSVTWIRRA